MNIMKSHDSQSGVAVLASVFILTGTKSGNNNSNHYLVQVAAVPLIPTCNGRVGLSGIQGERLGGGEDGRLGDGGPGTARVVVGRHAAHGLAVLAGVHVQQGVPGAGLHQLHDVGAHLPVRVCRGGVELLDVGAGGGLGGHGLPGENNC